MKKTRKLLAAFLCLTLVLILAACGKGESNSLTGKWIYDTGASGSSFPRQLEIFDDGTVNYDGYSGTYTTEGERLNLSLSMISYTYSYRITDGQLVLKLDNGTESFYSREKSDTLPNDKKENTNTVAMNIVIAHDFKDGYAFIKVGRSEDVEYYAVIDKNGSVGFSFMPEERESFLGSVGNRFYFANVNSEANLATVRCLDSSGKEIYNVNYATEEPALDYKYPELYKDGTILLNRTVSGYSSSGMQIALLDQNGKYKKNFFNIDTLKDKRGGGSQRYNPEYVKYCGNGFAFLYREFRWPTGNNTSSGILANIAEEKQFYMELDFGLGPNDVSEYIDGYIYLGKKHRVSASGKVEDITDVEIQRSSIGESLVFGVPEGIYDINSLKPILELNKNEYCGKFTNGLACLRLIGNDNRMYVTMIDKTGKQKFEPIHSDGTIRDLNNNILIAKDTCNYKNILNFYNIDGKKIRSVDLGTFGNYSCRTDSISDGLILIAEEKEGHIFPNYNYLTMDGKLLFPEGTIQIPVE